MRVATKSLMPRHVGEEKVAYQQVGIHFVCTVFPFKMDGVIQQIAEIHAVDAIRLPTFTTRLWFLWRFLPREHGNDEELAGQLRKSDAVKVKA
jgi:hypothetical protein